MKKPFKLIMSTLLVVGVVFLNSCKKKETETEKKEEAVAYDTKADSSLCMSDWFPHAQTPPPAEGKGSPFDTISTTNAIFHQWSWQKFLWVTKPTVEVTLIPIITQGEPTPIVIKTKLPLFLNPEKMHQVNSHLQKVDPKEGAAVVLTDTLQAGSGGVLKTNPAYNKNNVSETVFYSIHISPTMQEAAEKYRDSLASGALAKNNLATFPVGSLELKVSWVAKSAIPEDKIANYFTTVAAISTDGKNYTNTEVALLGMHVVGVVENHPEFIWATFEHDELAPNYNWKENNATSSANQLLFAEGTTTGINGITWNNGSAKEKYRAYDLFKFGVPRDSTGGFMKTSQSEPVNFDNIENINACVKKNLKDVWNHYFYNGSLWINTDGLNAKEQAELLVKLKDSLDDAKPGAYARGSVNCANVTMETYTQTFKDSLSEINAGNLANCFSCHNAENFSAGYPTSPLYLSHAFNAYIERSQGKTFKDVELLKAKQEVEEFMKNKLE